jgi:hypothetical protein
MKRGQYVEILSPTTYGEKFRWTAGYTYVRKEGDTIIVEDVRRGHPVRLNKANVRPLTCKGCQSVDFHSCEEDELCLHCEACGDTPFKDPRLLRRNDAYSPFGTEDPRPDSDYDPEQLRMGIKVEQEHTSHMPKAQAIKAAKRIAKDHLDERGDYYTRLEHVEEGSSWGWDSIFRF